MQYIVLSAKNAMWIKTYCFSHSVYIFKTYKHQIGRVEKLKQRELR